METEKAARQAGNGGTDFRMASPSFPSLRRKKRWRLKKVWSPFFSFPSFLPPSAFCGRQTPINKQRKREREKRGILYFPFLLFSLAQTSDQNFFVPLFSLSAHSAGSFEGRGHLLFSHSLPMDHSLVSAIFFSFFGHTTEK